MKKFGKLNNFGDLIIATNVLQVDNTIIINPTYEDYINNGYKELIYEEPLIEKIGYNTERYYVETDNCIYIHYRYVEIIEEEILDNN